MSRGWIIALLLSLGMNVGLVVSSVVRHRQESRWEQGNEGPRHGERRVGTRGWSGRDDDRQRPSRGPDHPNSVENPDSENPPTRGEDASGFEVSDRHLQRLAERLGIEGENRDRFVTLQRNFWRESRGHHQALDAARRALHEALSAPTPDPDEVERRLAASSRASVAMERALVEHVLAARDLLDGEAEERYLRFLDDLTERRSRGGHNFRRPGR
ncbi:MAG: periplasmic heavy metal sensor [Thermoanaerobaculia bacterium]|nr:periplasmic heavy metal sensor [Thermoanaerobaculia bacterium]